MLVTASSSACQLRGDCATSVNITAAATNASSLLHFKMGSFCFCTAKKCAAGEGCEVRTSAFHVAHTDVGRGRFRLAQREVVCYWLRYSDLQGRLESRHEIERHYERFGKPENRTLTCNGLPPSEVEAANTRLGFAPLENDEL